MKKIIIFFIIFLIFLLGCETEEVHLKLKCTEMDELSLILGKSVPNTIENECQSACINKLMEYSGSYKCDPYKGNLICDCIVNDQRREQREFAEEIEQQEEMQKEAMKEMGILSDEEAKEICTQYCSDTFQYANNVDVRTVYCGCSGEGSYFIDYDTKKPIDREEALERGKNRNPFFN